MPLNFTLFEIRLWLLSHGAYAKVCLLFEIIVESMNLKTMVNISL